MKTSLEHLSDGRRKQIETVTHLITRLIFPEKIILFGLWTSPAINADLVGHRSDRTELAIPDLLVVTRRGDRRDSCVLQDMVENRCRQCGPVSVLIHDVDYVNRQIEAGKYFFSTIRRDSILLFDAGLIALAVGPLPDFREIRKTAGQDFEIWGGRSRGFYRSAVFNCQQKEWKIAVFLLHQSAEHIYQAVLLSCSGYKPMTHNLDKLRRYTNRFSFELALLFPRNSAAEDRLFRLLLEGYVAARYSDTYEISEQEVHILAERIGRLIAIAERICKNRLRSLEKSVASLSEE